MGCSGGGYYSHRGRGDLKHWSEMKAEQSACLAGWDLEDEEEIQKAEAFWGWCWNLQQGDEQAWG